MGGRGQLWEARAQTQDRQPLSVQGKLLYLSMPSFSQLENGRNICVVELFQGLNQLTFTKHLEKYLALSNF